VKIYDQPSRFVREWKKGNVIRERRGDTRSSDAGDLLWQIPVFGFIVYFVYFYLSSFFWAFVLSHALFFFLIYAWNCWSSFFSRFRIARLVSRTFIWLFPLVNLAIFQLKWGNLAAVIFIAILWFTAAAIFSTSHRLHRKKINIARIEGRFAGIRRALYRLVLMIPLIGKRKQPFKALDRVSLEIGSGMFGLLGPNGAGKTTLMRVICGILDQSYGKVYINGIDTTKKREELQGLIGYLPQEFGTYENMTAREFLDYQAILKGLREEKKRREMVDYVLEAVHIEEHADRKIGAFSGGMKQRVGIAQILLHLPRILVVDEPTAGLDPRERIRFRNLLVELSRERVVIFSTHIIEDIYSSCNRVAVLNKGQLLYLDDPSKMTATAAGKVWTFSVEPSDFERIRKRHVVVHHMRDGEKIKVRCLAASMPVAGAHEARPTLEDAYLWLLRSSGSDILGVRDEMEGKEGGGGDEQI
jgi:ABC-type multidrug transport system ATPase subunit